MSRLTRLSMALIVGLGVAATAALADDLTGTDTFLCSAKIVLACAETGDCEEILPAELNVPQFIEIDLKEKMLRTTEASGENRSSPIEHQKRDAGEIVLQGQEQGRAFSFVISEATGRVTVAIARDGLGVTVFGACTPLP